MGKKRTKKGAMQIAMFKVTDHPSISEAPMNKCTCGFIPNVIASNFIRYDDYELPDGRTACVVRHAKPELGFVSYTTPREWEKKFCGGWIRYWIR